MSLLKTAARRMMSGGKLTDTIDLLLHHLPEDEQDRSDIILLSARLTDLKSRENDGTVSSADRQLEVNQIRKALLSSIDAIPKDFSVELTPQEQLAVQHVGLQQRNQRYRWIIGAGLYLVLAGVMGWWLLGDQQQFRIEGSITADQVSFQYEKGTSFLPSTFMDRVGLQYFSSIQLPAEALVFDQDTISGIEGGEVLSIKPAIPGVDPEVIFRNVGLSRISPTQGSNVVLQRPSEQDPNSFLLQINKEEASYYELTYEQEVAISGDYLSLSHFTDVESYAGASQFTGLAPSSTKTLEIEGIPHESILSFSHHDPVSLPRVDLEVWDLQLSREHEDQAISSVLEGEIRFREAEDESDSPQTIRLGKSENLAILSDDVLAITSLEFSEQGIQFTFEGEVNEVQTGRKFTTRNPPRWEWLWANQKTTLVAIGIIMLGLLFFVPIAWLNRIKAVKGIVG